MTLFYVFLKVVSTPEIKVLVPLIKNLGNTLIAMVSNKSSFLAKNSDYVLHAFAEKEACPNNLAPTTSTSVQLVLGDALAVALLEMRAFQVMILLSIILEVL